MSDDKQSPPEEERTVIAPGGTAPPPAGPALPSPTPPAAAPESGATAPTFAPHKGAVGIKEGDVLNHIFEVKRFLARGGMGEVFEGCNVNTDEKVAIKVMLPALASDEKVIAMFRKEARTLTKLHHPALVQYRVLAQEPQLGVLYIVTDFIEGDNLGNALGEKRSPDELAGLLRQLAAGLGAAHRLGAVHRDMSPDNVLLENDDIHQAKIIDFGIAKDLEAGSATIVGDGFAGKLNYVAPEQLGDFGREIGPWTDVYSLGLVILAVAQGKSVDMSGSLVDAIDKRRRGPDLAAIPASLRPLLEAMLRPDPKERLRSMDDVLAMLDGARIPSPQTAREALPALAGEPAPARSGGAGKWVLIVLLAIGLLAALAFGYSYWRDHPDLFGASRGSETNTIVPIQTAGDPVERARSAINSVLPSVSCTWLDVVSLDGGETGMTVALRGVAGDPSVARDQIASALAQANLREPNISMADVAPINQSGCAALDAFRQVRAVNGGHLEAAQTRFEMVPQVTGNYAGRDAATARLNLDVGAGGDFALVGIQPSGDITVLIPNRAVFEQALAASRGGRPIQRTGNGSYAVHIDADHTGWSGIMLVSGQGPFDLGLIQPPVAQRGPDWSERFRQAAAQRGWRTEMVWYESVNRQAEASSPPPEEPPAEPPPEGGKPEE
ncbi:MAG TPA: serine/threonine-protein kinase [Allosphingosinicella sp.]|nr:serine/threonine-protein kinase [Allosphingosinicella sp.]